MVFLELMILVSALTSLVTCDRVLVDMTYPYAENETAYWPTDYPRLKLEEVYVGPGDGYWYELYKFSTVDHAGTHIDAPSHFTKGGRTVDEIPLEQLVSPAVVIDISDRAAANPDEQLTSRDLQAWETKHGAIPEGAVVLMHSGWGQHYDNKTAYFGTSTNDTTKLRFPGFHKEASEWLVNKRNIHGVGVDTPSFDYGKSQEFWSHRTILTNGLFGLENLMNVGQLPASGATLYIMPMKIKGASGAPCRVLATWDKSSSLSGRTFPCLLSICICLLFSVLIYFYN